MNFFEICKEVMQVGPELCAGVQVLWNDAAPAPTLGPFGALAARAELDARLHLHPRLAAYDGWVRQQALKLLAAKRSDADACVVLDAKNFFTRTVRKILQNLNFVKSFIKLILAKSSYFCIQYSIFWHFSTSTRCCKILCKNLQNFIGFSNFVNF